MPYASIVARVIVTPITKGKRVNSSQRVYTFSVPKPRILPSPRVRYHWLIYVWLVYQKLEGGKRKKKKNGIVIG